MKILKDQLANVVHPISEQQLVLRLFSALINTEFDMVATMIQQMKTLPSIGSARSRLLLKESRSTQDPGSQNSNFVAQNTTAPPSTTTAPPPQPPSSDPRGGGGRDSGRGGRQNRSQGRGRGVNS